MSAQAAGTGTVLYEVTLRVASGIADAVGDWLQAHVAEMVTLPGFLDARVARLREPAEPDAVVFCCLYRLRDAAALDAYLREHAPRMREDGLRRFPGGFTASRRVLDLLDDAVAPAA